MSAQGRNRLTFIRLNVDSTGMRCGVRTSIRVWFCLHAQGTSYATHSHLAVTRTWPKLDARFRSTGGWQSILLPAHSISCLPMNKLHLGLTCWKPESSWNARSLCDQASHAEQLEFDSYWLPENHFGNNAMPSPLTQLAAVSALSITRSMTIG